MGPDFTAVNLRVSITLRKAERVSQLLTPYGANLPEIILRQIKKSTTLYAQAKSVIKVLEKEANRVVYCIAQKRLLFIVISKFLILDRDLAGADLSRILLWIS